uniref:MAM domain-containing protein, meprin/A5/mu n=1 Tax=Candidatus Kentrum sp. UNK TaxID=2126344 RepID=A0A451B1Y4_9GAMM|nr:MAG: MAM domain-containing protein, meprin/A5/mu [Candidatus Kentron sp. UNK]VFK72284.1 MAG: MAM domain-containing protein, meprin/A5/mu [Candidatus Kentron sp. UNK]
MYGRHMGTLAVETFDGSAWRPVWRISGQQHANHSSAWTQKRLDLSGRTVEKIRFKGTTGSGYRGDMAIDQVTITTGESPEPPTAASPWSKSGSNIYYADSDGGNVGIGDNAPTADLSVLGNLSRALAGHVMASAGSTRVIGAETVFSEELRAGDSLLIGDAVFVVTGIQSDTALTVDTAPTVSTHNATAYTDSDLLIVETGAEKTALVVDRTGNVGIGTAEPKAKLDVAGGIKVGNETVCDAGKAGTIRYDNAGKEVEVCDGSGWSRAGLQGERGPVGPQGPQGPKVDTSKWGSCYLTGWFSKAPLEINPECRNGYYQAGIGFKHIVHQNLTYQESIRLKCCRF